MGDTSPLPSVYLGRQNIIHMIKWTVGRPGNEAKPSHEPLHSILVTEVTLEVTMT